MDTEKTKDQMKEALQILAALNKGLEENEAWQQEKQALLEQAPIYQQLLKIQAEKKEIKAKIEMVRDHVKTYAEGLYQSEGDKKPADGVEVRIYTKYEYDPELALDYCKQALPLALKLDTKTFEKYVKGVQEVKPLPFVEVIEDPRVMISSDLTEYLRQE